LVDREKLLRDPKIDVVLFDELNIVLKMNYLDSDIVLADIADRPEMKSVIIKVVVRLNW